MLHSCLRNTWHNPAFKLPFAVPLQPDWFLLATEELEERLLPPISHNHEETRIESSKGKQTLCAPYLTNFPS